MLQLDYRTRPMARAGSCSSHPLCRTDWDCRRDNPAASRGIAELIDNNPRNRYIPPIARARLDHVFGGSRGAFSCCAKQRPNVQDTSSRHHDPLTQRYIALRHDETEHATCLPLRSLPACLKCCVQQFAALCWRLAGNSGTCRPKTRRSGAHCVRQVLIWNLSWVSNWSSRACHIPPKAMKARTPYRAHMQATCLYRSPLGARFSGIYPSIRLFLCFGDFAVCWQRRRTAIGKSTILAGNGWNYHMPLADQQIPIGQTLLSFTSYPEPGSLPIICRSKHRVGLQSRIFAFAILWSGLHSSCRRPTIRPSR